VAEARRRWTPGLQETFAVCEVTERSALEQVTAHLRPHILVLDLALPRLGRVHGLPAIQQLSPSTRMLVLTDVPADSEALCALRAGARGYDTRSIDPGHLKKAVQAIRKGEIWVQRKFIQSLVAELMSLTELRQTVPDPTADRRLERLTGRQRVVAELISRGACNKEVAARLKIAERTVKAHLTEAFRNLGVSDRLQLALLLTGRSRARLDQSGPPAGPS